MKIQQALCLGRQHRLSAQFTKAKLKELKTERLDNAGLAEILEFELQLKKRELEQALVPSDQQREELRILAKDFHRMRNNKDVIERNLVILDEGDKKEIERWRDAWFEVDKLLDTTNEIIAPIKSKKIVEEAVPLWRGEERNDLLGQSLNVEEEAVHAYAREKL
ncbi:hypothetical protein J4E90_007934 [Alternaria incomplexa]|uniref:uncharacterized protein n=1 Tax=Alternaria incomplexa TaxID=1187928 RepID=UPI00221EC221|nr:uncharacterized protein J4E90_007934 [Alternaria incomplexa]KAI4909237.1 hypothetical protein J4E90_007934 [Alternaria incomplexa]